MSGSRCTLREHGGEVFLSFFLSFTFLADRRLPKAAKRELPRVGRTEMLLWVYHDVVFRNRELGFNLENQLKVTREFISEPICV